MGQEGNGNGKEVNGEEGNDNGKELNGEEGNYSGKEVNGEEGNDNGKELNGEDVVVNECLEKINNKEINDEIIEDFLMEMEPISMTPILNEPSVMTQLENEAYDKLLKEKGRPCYPISSLVVGESSKEKSSNGVDDFGL
ncbi:hypothetical protein L2E82_06281 [Cichorium intybus]|uniref:Uncharacterized protein n=1 Tax=Cichorium intybus TaxID=13427 RepID=A0ACB9H9G0_CICIN|nr:hypothetical protein L2E82_06281 [Cichorium intybus]